MKGHKIAKICMMVCLILGMVLIPANKLRLIYPNMMKLTYDNIRTYIKGDCRIWYWWRGI